MPKYMLMLHESPTAFKGLSPTEIQAIIQKYIDWKSRLERDGRYLGGEKLKPEGRAVRRQGSEVNVTDGPFGEVKEVVGGFFIMKADSFEHAIELAKEGPHLDRGWIEIRQVDRE